jgi:hypothetical protein
MEKFKQAMGYKFLICWTYLNQGIYEGNSRHTEVV